MKPVSQREGKKVVIFFITFAIKGGRGSSTIKVFFSIIVFLNHPLMATCPYCLTLVKISQQPIRNTAEIYLKQFIIDTIQCL